MPRNISSTKLRRAAIAGLTRAIALATEKGDHVALIDACGRLERMAILLDRIKGTLPHVDSHNNPLRGEARRTAPAMRVKVMSPSRRPDVQDVRAAADVNDGK